MQVSRPVRHISTFSGRHFHNCSTYSLYFSSHWACSPVCNPVSLIEWTKIYSKHLHHFCVADIKISDPENFLITDKKLYVDVLCFLTFNFSAMMGSLVTSWIQWVTYDSLQYPTEKANLNEISWIFFSRKKSSLCGRYFCAYCLFHYFWCAITSRWTLNACCQFTLKTIGSIGLLATYWAFRPDIWGKWRTHSVHISTSTSTKQFSDCSSLGMMYAPQTVEPQYAQTAGMFAAAMLITGIFTGISSSVVYPKIVSSISW